MYVKYELNFQALLNLGTAQCIDEVMETFIFLTICEGSGLCEPLVSCFAL